MALSGLPLSGLVEVKTGGRGAQVESLGANSSKVTAPVGLEATASPSPYPRSKIPTNTTRRRGGRDGRGGLSDGHRLGLTAGADGGVVAVTAVGGHPLVGARGDGRDGARGGAAPARADCREVMSGGPPAGGIAPARRAGR